MTQLGKILIYVNLTLSIIFAAWALGVYTQRVDWGNKAASGTRPAGELFKRTEEIKRLTESRTRADVRWYASLGELRRLEDRRIKDAAYFDQELRDLQQGMNQVKRLVYTKGELQVKDGRPILEPAVDENNQPLNSILATSRQYDQLVAEIRSEMQLLDKLILQEKDLTVQLMGDGANVKGLRPQLAWEQKARQDSLAEQDYLEPLMYNRQVEAVVLQNRQKQLRARIQELQGTTAARAP